jgi:radical SAM protein with 4Fe4S-binding SPASM domain
MPRWLSKAPIPSGLYSYRGKDEFSRLALQLRVESDGRGVLAINANTVLYLNETAAAHVYCFMQGMPTEKAVKQIRSLYRVDEEKARTDHEKLIYNISTLAQTEEVCPISYLGVERVEPFSQTMSAPIRMDLALTFRCQNGCLHCYTGGPHETEEMSAEKWKLVLNKMKNLGIFIATFTGGEPTLRGDLPELIAHAQKLGIVTGLVTNGRSLKDKDYVAALEKCGLDFAQVTLESSDPNIHDRMTGSPGSWEETVAGIRNLIPTQVYTTTNTTLTKLNASGFLETLEFVHDLGVREFGCNGLIHSGRGPEFAKDFGLSSDELKTLLPRIQERAAQLSMTFLWYTPTRYCELDPVSLGLGVKSCTACGMNMCIGPSGDVYPCQSYFQSLGRFLETEWKRIWNHSLSKQLRARMYAPDDCGECPDYSVCGAGCPLELQDPRGVARPAKKPYDN